MCLFRSSGRTCRHCLREFRPQHCIPTKHMTIVLVAFVGPHVHALPGGVPREGRRAAPVLHPEAMGAYVDRSHEGRVGDPILPEDWPHSIVCVDGLYTQGTLRCWVMRPLAVAMVSFVKVPISLAQQLFNFFSEKR